MSTGSRYEATNYNYTSKYWDGNNDPNRSADNAYNMYLSRGSRLEGKSMAYGVETSFLPTYPSVNVPPFDPNLQLKVLADIAEQIKGHGLDVGNSIAEGRQTVNSVVAAAGAMARAARAVRHGDLGGALRALGQAPSGSNKKRLSLNDPGSTWLSMQYGWLPLLSDVYEAATNWEAVTAPPRKFKLRKRKRARVVSTTPEGHYMVQHRDLTSYEARVHITESISVPRALGLTDPLGIAWEVVPWSFVVDWFLPISTYLDTLNVFQGLDATVAWTYYYSCESTIVDIAPGFEVINSFGVSQCPKAQVRELTIVRTSRSGVSVPLPRPVEFANAMSPLRIANAVALMGQQIGRLFR